ncbi:hypothetical protein IA539_13285, partial [Gordonia sp. zg691]|nr:hypothetical protein [Gordonia jinghuaiqii]
MSDTPDAGANGGGETLSNKAAKKRRRREPPPDPTPLPGLVDAHTHLAACGGRDAESVRAILDHAQAVGGGPEGKPAPRQGATPRAGGG